MMMSLAKSKKFLTSLLNKNSNNKYLTSLMHVVHNIIYGSSFGFQQKSTYLKNLDYIDFYPNTKSLLGTVTDC